MGIAVLRRLRSFCVRRGKAIFRRVTGSVRRLRKRCDEILFMVRSDWKSSFRPTLGQQGERAAERFLRRKGWKILLRNFRGAHGEIDRIMRDGKTIVFVEVKTRRSRKFFEGRYRRFGPRKKLAIYRTSIAFLRRYRMTRDPVRYDLVTVLCEKKGDWEIHHFRDVIHSNDRHGVSDHRERFSPTAR